MMLKWICVGLSLTLAAACGSSDDEPGTPSQEALGAPECNPLGGTNCMTPWPSSLYAIDDDTTETGRRLEIPMGALPTNLDGLVIDPAQFNARDGFSAAAPMITAFPGGIDGSNLVGLDRYGDSLTDASPTVLVNMDTGELVGHFAELDLRVPDEVNKQALYIRPAVRLDGSTRYAVAIKRTLKGPGGSDLEIPAGFQAILDDRKTKHDRLETIRPRYDEIFAALAVHDISREELVVAWDFTTASNASMRRDLITARDRALEVAGVDGINLSYNIEVDDRIGDDIRRVQGTFSVPLLLNQDGKAVPGTVLTRDDRNLPEVVGMMPVGFTAMIPDCAADVEDGAGFIVYGNGLLGSHDQADGGHLQENARDMCAAVVGTDMRGMSEVDVPNVLRSLNDFNLADQTFDVLIQGMVNHFALVQIVRGPMSTTIFGNGEQTYLDRDKVYYYGLSQGHIFGTTVAAYDPHIQRAVLGVGGANYSMMLERSLDWPTYRNTVIGAYDDPLNVAIIINLMQMRWDTTEPANTITDLPGNPIPGTPAKQFLLHMAVGDDEVPNISTEYQARTMGIPVIGPAVYTPWGLEEALEPVSNGLVIWDDGDGPIPSSNTAPADNDAHSKTRKFPAAIRQMTHFFQTGEIIHTCGEGTPCDCTAGACE
ncbi:MAG: hypothetical protein KJO07_12215 [Deltaproteobacteria bacterium]|nr:hypothetical protein [Deltaproteobacteria bacterium]